MPVPTYRWPAASEFVDRERELGILEAWWHAPQREPLSLYGRRRVGKSWLFRRFAHGKRAVIVVADRVAAGQQLTQIAAQLEPVLGFRPALSSAADLVEVLCRLSARGRVLAVIDEFPYLLGTTAGEQQRSLTAIQAVLENERDRSRVKLLLAGSAVAQMEALQAERSPMHGRLRPLPLRPLEFVDATLLMQVSDPLDQVERFAVAGGMPRYLQALGRDPLPERLATQVVDRDAPLFNEPRTLLQAELREPAVYFSILQSLSGSPRNLAAVAAHVGVSTSEASRYLATLQDLTLVSAHRPVGAPVASRTSQWRCDDDFVRFWFRFVQPYQGDLEAGADARAHVDLTVVPHLAEHVSPTLEELVRTWLRREYTGRATSVGGWWGPSLHALRAAKVRTTEEVDGLAIHGRRVVAVAEAKWTSAPLGLGVLDDLHRYKLPALTQAGFDVTGCEIVLASRSGFGTRLAEQVRSRPDVRLLDAAALVGDLAVSGSG